ncbi:hypothetical protein [Paenibacillus donghaensis]|uniref:Phage gp6-like head-tail connector protein n=1 Tax=Paenibacillus donghaensis TaxID=414771 RepID=A0A2Z2KYA1_9BACL|nr:hypothetical protein [Paenibacillus donghaensis]ASA25418.1 hypothetical protein B9T62_34615 [Paenibacillus donghaensis]
MTDAELLIECKIGLGYSSDVNETVDKPMKQKLLAVKSYLRGAGVSEEMLQDPLAVGVIVMGVSDLWEVKSGEVKFSPAFFTLAYQLAVRS